MSETATLGAINEELAKTRRLVAKVDCLLRGGGAPEIWERSGRAYLVETERRVLETPGLFAAVIGDQGRYEWTTRVRPVVVSAAPLVLDIAGLPEETFVSAPFPGLPDDSGFDLRRDGDGGLMIRIGQGPMIRHGDVLRLTPRHDWTSVANEGAEP